MFSFDVGRPPSRSLVPLNLDTGVLHDLLPTRNFLVPTDPTLIQRLYNKGASITTQP
jgi:hypothetical protein